MSPTVFRYGAYRFYFFSREETRIHVHVHVHVHGRDGEVKFWVAPEVALANNYGLADSQIAELLGVVEEHKNEIRDAWEERFTN